MTTQTKSKSKTEDRLRKVAILLQSLEPQVADRMLEQFDEKTAQEIRHWLISLPEISKAEEQAVIEEFLGSGAVKPSFKPAAESDEVTVEFSTRARKQATDAVQATQRPEDQRATAGPTSNDRRPFARLQSATPELLVEFLQEEHPQVIAVVLSNIPPKTAADVVRNLPGQLRGDVLARIGRLREIDRVALDRIEDELAERLSAKLIESSAEDPGEETLAAILAATPAEEHARFTRELRSQAPTLADRVEVRLKTSVPSQHTTSGETSSHPIPLYGQAADEYVPAARMQKTNSKETRSARDAGGSGFRFSELITLDDRTLAGVMARCEPRVLVIALAGAEEKLVDRICSRLDRGQAKQLRMRINSPGPLALADVDEAQRRVAAQADALLQRRTSRAA